MDFSSFSLPYFQLTTRCVSRCPRIILNYFTRCQTFCALGPFSCLSPEGSSSSAGSQCVCCFLGIFLGPTYLHLARLLHEISLQVSCQLLDFLEFWLIFKPWVISTSWLTCLPISKCQLPCLTIISLRAEAIGCPRSLKRTFTLLVQ